MNSSKKFQLVMNDRYWTLLNELKERTGKETLTEVVKEALIALDWMQSQREEGREVVARQSEGIVSFQRTASPNLPRCDKTYLRHAD